MSRHHCSPYESLVYHDVLSITMLPAQFYTLNATTSLLWMFQSCSHEVLLLLIVLGATCLVISTGMLICRIISVVIRVAIFLFSVLFRLAFARHSFLRQIQPALPSNLLEAGQQLASIANNVSATANRLSLRGYSLPQALALNPAQWAELEANSSCAPTPSSEQVAQVDFISPPSPMSPVRRSTRNRTRSSRFRVTHSS